MYGSSYTGNNLIGADLIEEPYRQHRVNIKGRFADNTRDLLVTNETDNRRAIFSGSSRPGIFDMLKWELAFEIEGMTTEEDSVPRVLTALNGFGNDEMEAVLRTNDQRWLAELMTYRVRYIGNPTGNWSADRSAFNQMVGLQIQGVRPFWAFEECPLHGLIKYSAPTIDEAQEMLPNLPAGTAQGKVPLIVKPFDPNRDVVTTFYYENSKFLEDKNIFQRQLNMKYERASKKVYMLNKIHDWQLGCALKFIDGLVSSNIIQISIPNDAPIKATTDVGLLTYEKTVNWLLSAATKMELLPAANYPQIKNNDTSEATKDAWRRLRIESLRGFSPSNNALYWFGFDKRTGANEGYDSLRRTLKEGTANGDMIQFLINSPVRAMAAVGDFVYESTRTILGRVITPAKKFSFGAFI